MDELDPSAREMLRRARDARTPTAEDRERLERRIAATLAVAGAVAATGAATASATAGAASTGAAVVKTGGAVLWAKGLVVALVVGAAATGAVIAVQTPSAPETREERPALEAPDTVRIVGTTEVPVDDPSIVTEEVVLGAANDDAVAAPEQPRTRRRAPSPTPSADDLGAELELLHDAQHAWRAGDGARTLRLVTEHEDRFARSQLAPERTTLRILALCNVGRVDEARRAASRFLRTARQSPLRRSVEESCAAQ